jgi:hypothetical protein
MPRGSAETCPSITTDAIILSTRLALDAQRPPHDAPLGIGFVDHDLRQSELPVLIRCRQGSAATCEVAAAGDLDTIVDILRRVPLEEAVKITAYLTSKSRAAAERGSPVAPEIDRLLNVVMQRLDPHQEHGVPRGPPIGGYIDATVRVGTLGMLIKGWLVHDVSDQLREAAVVSLFGRRVLLRRPLPAVGRPDVIEATSGKIASRDPTAGSPSSPRSKISIPRTVSGSSSARCTAGRCGASPSSSDLSRLRFRRSS